MLVVLVLHGYQAKAVEQMPYYQRGIVNTSFVYGVCSFTDFLCTSLTVLLIVVVVLGLHVQIQHTHHSLIESCYFTGQIKSLFNASNSII
jgi:hypothetical protein